MAVKLESGICKLINNLSISANERARRFECDFAFFLKFGGTTQGILAVIDQVYNKERPADQFVFGTWISQLTLMMDSAVQKHLNGEI